MARTREVKESGNGRWLGSSVRVSLAREMRAFDRLPPAVRQAFREAIVDSTATGFSKTAQQFGEVALARAIAEADRELAFEFLCHEFGRADAVLITGHEPRPFK